MLRDAGLGVKDALVAGVKVTTVAMATWGCGRACLAERLEAPDIDVVAEVVG
jgi:hypothetical protein